MASDDKGEDENDTASAAIRKAAHLTAFIVGTTINDCLVNSSSDKLLSIKGMDVSNLLARCFVSFVLSMALLVTKG